MMRILSLGAGVQSSTLALKIKHGEMPMVDAAIFADTGAEPDGVYRWLDWLETQLPFPVYRVMHKQGLLKNIEESINGGRFAGAPFYTESTTEQPAIEHCDVCSGDGDLDDVACDFCEGKGYVLTGGNVTIAGTKREGTLRRQCTREFKVTPITKKIRELIGLKKGERAGDEVRVIQYLGISWDEAIRMKPSRQKWIKHEWPLVEQRLTRQHCLQWMKEHGYPMPTKSACTFCPFHNDGMWRDMKMNDPKSWQQAVDVDRMIRGGVRGTTQKLYLHRSLKPLEELDLRNAEDHGQIDAFGNECEGLCGV